ncbi:MAG: hypothetical protein IJM28_01735 [Lachnospiraceae bacterium]|nr:hypothetical protein [Lachnospiraceae bacterium]
MQKGVSLRAFGAKGGAKSLKVVQKGVIPSFVKKFVKKPKCRGVNIRFGSKGGAKRSLKII